MDFNMILENEKKILEIYYLMKNLEQKIKNNY